MNAPPHRLFRDEALRNRTDRLQGNVSLAVPISWQIIGGLLFGGLIAALVFLASASYARIAPASGIVTLNSGLAAVMPSRPGVIRSIAVTEGQHVKAGQSLLDVRAEEDLLGGETASSRIRDALAQQDARLHAQATLTLQAAGSDQARLREQIRGAQAELVSLGSQVSDQRRLITSAESDFENAKRIAGNGFISRHDLDTREATLLSRRQQLAQLQQLAIAKRAELAEAGRAIGQTTANARAQAATTEASRAALKGQAAQANLARGYALNAPVDGVVTALTARLGQAVAPDQQLMLVVPSGSRPSAELYIPTSAAGFVAPGQKIRLAVDAFPYQTFGTVPATVRRMSRAAITKSGPNGPMPVYLVTADLAYPFVTVSGRRQLLLPGMTLSARIVTEHRSLLQWLFEPLFAVRNR